MTESNLSVLAPPRASQEAPPARVAAVVLTLILMPFPVILHRWGPNSFDYGTMLFPVDLALVGLLAVGAAPLARRIRTGDAGAGTVLWACLAAVMSLAWLVHPSVRGLHTVVELWAVAVLAGTIAEALDGGLATLVVGSVGAIAILETAWATTQLATGSPLGLRRLGELPDPFLPFTASVKAPMGTMVHIYVLAALGLTAGALLAWRSLTAEHPARWQTAAAVAVVPVGFTFSRTGAITLVVVLAGFVVAGVHSRRAGGARRFAGAALALCVGAGVPAAVWSSGWHSRATQTTSATSAAQLTTDRFHLDHEAIDQIGANPVAGVGPGRYLASLKARWHVEPDRSVGIFKPVHDVVLLVTAEGGLLAGAVLVLLLGVVGWRALRAGPVALTLFALFVPFALLDHFNYTYAQGLVLTGVWLGVMDHVGRP